MFDKIKRYSLLSAMFVSIMLVANDASAQTLGEMFDGIRANINIMSALSVMSWIMGAFLTALGIRKISQHADAPQQIQIQEPVKYLIAGGMFLSIPSIAGVVQRGFGDGGAAQSINFLNWDTAASGDGEGLDNMMQNFIQDAYEPFQNLLVVFCYLAGAVLLMVAIHRFTKTAQEGPRGPTGLGTIATFILSGVLFSFASTVGVFTETLFGDRTSRTIVNFLALSDASAEAQANAENVMTAVLAFLIIVGILSIVRGFFVLRGVAEGTQGNTMMGGLSHVFAGAILVNFGQFANIIQNTLGIDLAVSFV